MARLRNWYERQIDRLGKLLQIDLRYLIRGNLWLGGSHFFTILTLLLMNVAIGRLISRFEYGQYQYILSISEIVGAFALSGFTTVIVQRVARGQDGILQLALKKNLLWSGGVLIVGIALAIYYFFKHTPVYGIAFLAIAVTMPLYLSFSFSDYFLLGKKDFRSSGLLNIFASVGTTGSLIIALFLHADLLQLLLTYLISRTIFEAASYAITTWLYPHTNVPVEKGAITYAAHLSIMGVLNTFADQADSLWVFHFLGPVSLAVYSFAVAPSELLKGFLKKLGSMILPNISKQSIREIRSRLWQRMILLAAGMIPVIAVYVAIAPFLFRSVLPQYESAVGYSQLFSLSLLIVAPLILVVSALRTIARKDQLYAYNVSSELFQTLALLAGTYYFGLLGTISAYFCARLFRLVFGSYLIWTTREEILT